MMSNGMMVTVEQEEKKENDEIVIIQKLEDNSVISSDPNAVKSHFTVIEAPNRKGQARYRCRTCRHEFASTGKVRLIQHVVGLQNNGSNSKNVRACPVPYEPLRAALLAKKAKEQAAAAILSLTASSSSRGSGSANVSGNKSMMMIPPPSLPSPRSDHADHESVTSDHSIEQETTIARHSVAYTIATAFCSVEEEEGTEVQEDNNHNSHNEAPIETKNLQKRVRAASVEELCSSQADTEEESVDAVLPATKKKRSIPPLSFIHQEKVQKEDGNGKETERLLSLLQFVQQISPETLEMACMLQNMKEGQGIAQSMPLSSLSSLSPTSVSSNCFFPSLFPNSLRAGSIGVASSSSSVLSNTSHSVVPPAGFSPTLLKTKIAKK